MPRPYRDPVELHAAPVPAQSPFIPNDAKIVVGAVAPASPDPIPIVLLPGFEYRLREWRHPETHKIHWQLERRKAAPSTARTTTVERPGLVEPVAEYARGRRPLHHRRGERPRPTRSCRCSVTISADCPIHGARQRRSLAG